MTLDAPRLTQERTTLTLALGLGARLRQAPQGRGETGA